MTLLLLACTDGAAVIGPVAECDTGCEDTAPITGEHVIELSINEVMADNDESYLTDDGESPDWLELYNAGDADLDLEGFLLRDNITDGEPHVISGSVVVPAGGHALLLATGTPELGPDHLAFRINAGGEDLGIYTPDDQAIDLLTFGNQVKDLALARSEDGGPDWEYVAGGTPGESND